MAFKQVREATRAGQYRKKAKDQSRLSPKDSSDVWALPTAVQQRATAVGGAGGRAAARTGPERPKPMATQLLLTAHHHQAMAIACERGMWLPLPLPVEKLPTLFYLAALAPAAEAISALAEISCFEPWSEGLWLPMLGRLLPLPRPVPLGDRQVLAEWLPSRSDQFKLLDLLPVLEAGRLSDLVCGRPGRGGAPGPVRAPRRARRAGLAHRLCGTAH